MLYRRNHTIPRFMLRYWVDKALPYEAIHVYDIRKQRQYVSSGKGKKGFSFAIENDLYVHTASGDRAVGLEKWFAGLEGALSRFARQVHERREPIEFEAQGATQTMMAAIGLAWRSAYNLRKIKAAIEAGPDLIAEVSRSAEDPAKTILENVVHAVTENVGRVSPSEMTIILAPDEGSWLLSDRPSFIEPKTGMSYVVLTNRVVLGYRRSPGELRYRYLDASTESYTTLNKMIALQARDWLVAVDAQQLSGAVSVFQTKEWAQYCATDRVVLEPLRLLRRGWSINS